MPPLAGPSGQTPAKRKAPDDSKTRHAEFPDNQGGDQSSPRGAEVADEVDVLRTAPRVPDAAPFLDEQELRPEEVGPAMNRLLCVVAAEERLTAPMFLGVDATRVENSVDGRERVKKSDCFIPETGYIQCGMRRDPYFGNFIRNAFANRHPDDEKDYQFEDVMHRNWKTKAMPWFEQLTRPLWKFDHYQAPPVNTVIVSGNDLLSVNDVRSWAIAIALAFKNSQLLTKDCIIIADFNVMLKQRTDSRDGAEPYAQDPWDVFEQELNAIDPPRGGGDQDGGWSKDVRCYAKVKGASLHFCITTHHSDVPFPQILHIFADVPAIQKTLEELTKDGLETKHVSFSP